MSVRWRGLFLIVAIGGLAAAVLWPSVEHTSRLANLLHNAAHGVAFGAIAVLFRLQFAVIPLFNPLPPWHRYAWALGLSAALGGLTEFLQIPLARDASLEDLRNNVLGACVGLALLAAFDRKTMVRWRVVVLLAAIAPAALLAMPVVTALVAYDRRDSTFPTIADFAVQFDAFFVAARAAMLSQEVLPEPWASTPGERALLIRFQGLQSSGIDFVEPSPNWSGYKWLGIDLTNPNRVLLDVQLRVHDADHDYTFADRFNITLRLEPHERTMLLIPLSDIAAGPKARTLDLTRVASLMLFVANSESVRAGDGLFVSRVWLD